MAITPEQHTIQFDTDSRLLLEELHNDQQSTDGFTWALKPREIEILAGNADEIDPILQERSLYRVMVGQDPHFCGYAKEEFGLDATNFITDKDQPEQLERWTDALSGYARVAQAVTTGFSELTSLVNIPENVMLGIENESAAKRAACIDELQQGVLEKLRDPEVYEWLGQHQTAEEIDRLHALPFVPQVQILKKVHELHEADKAEKEATRLREEQRLAEEQARAEAAQASDDTETSTDPERAVIDVSDMGTAGIMRTKVDGHTYVVFKAPTTGQVIKGGKDAASVAGMTIANLAEKAQENTTKPVAIGLTGLAIAGGTFAIDALKGDDLARDPATAITNQGNKAENALFGSIPKPENADANNMSSIAAETAAGRVVVHASNDGEIAVARKALGIMQHSPLVIAQHHNLDSGDRIPRKLRKNMIQNATDYMNQLVSLAHETGSIAEHDKNDHAHSSLAIARISAFAEYGLHRLIGANTQLTPEQLNTTAEQLTNAILAAKHPEVASIIWKDQYFHSNFEKQLGKQLMQHLFGEKSHAYTTEQQELITSFLTKAIEMTSPSGHENLEKSMHKALVAAERIAKHGTVSGHPRHKLPMYNGYYLPKANSPADKLYRFLIKDVHLTPAAAAGGVGSFSVESASFRVVNGFGGGGNKFYGIGQWDPVSRAPRLRLFAKQHGLNYRSFKGQLHFIKHELTTSEKATLWRLRHFHGTAAEAASLWGRHYERAVNPDGSLQGEPTRRARAQGYLHEVQAEKTEALQNLTAEHGDWRDKVTDLGMHTTYVMGKKVQQRLYAVHGLPSAGDESQPGNRYYIKGAEGRAIANEEAAKSLVKLVHMAKIDGLHLQLASSTRTDKHQEALAASNPDRNEVAEPHFSRHEGGRAFDFNLNGQPLIADHYPTLHGGMPSVSNPRTAQSSHVWNWLVKNAPKAGLKMFFNEPWHWSLDGK